MPGTAWGGDTARGDREEEEGGWCTVGYTVGAESWAAATVVRWTALTAIGAGVLSAAALGGFGRAAAVGHRGQQTAEEERVADPTLSPCVRAIWQARLIYRVNRLF